jgi:hypothetical protein
VWVISSLTRHLIRLSHRCVSMFALNSFVLPRIFVANETLRSSSWVTRVTQCMEFGVHEVRPLFELQRNRRECRRSGARETLDPGHAAVGTALLARIARVSTPALQGAENLADDSLHV